MTSTYATFLYSGLRFSFCSFFLPLHPKNPQTPFGTPSVTFGMRQRPPAVQRFAFGLMFWDCEAAYKTAEKFKPEKTKSIGSSIFKTGKKKKKLKSSQCLNLTPGFFMSSDPGCFDFMLFYRCLWDLHPDWVPDLVPSLKVQGQISGVWWAQSQSGGIFHIYLPLESPCSASTEEWRQESQ